MLSRTITAAFAVIVLAGALGAAPSPQPPRNGTSTSGSSTPALRRARAIGRQRFTQAVVTVESQTFAGISTEPYFWEATGDACLSAGTNATPASSVPACDAASPADASGSGTLQLTSSSYVQNGMVVLRTPLQTSRGIQVVFTDYAYHGTTPGGDGLSMFFSDASKAIPTAEGTLLGSLGYAVPGAYLGIGYDEYGNFSAYGNGASGNGFPGHIPETIALRGSAASGFQYLGGVTAADGAPASLPFSIDTPAATTRPSNAPTFRTTLEPTGETIVEIDHHDGNGFLTYFDKNVSGLNGQPVLPQQVYLAFASTTGGAYNTHQLADVTVSYLTPAATSFTPSSIPNLAAWYDASDASTLVATAGAVSTWTDKSGNGNALTQSATAAMPASGTTIDGLGALSFSGAQYLKSANAALSQSLFNESTVFVVASQPNATQNSSVLAAGPIGETTARYDLRLSDGGVSRLDFNNTAAGELTGSASPTGAALWTAAGSVSGATEFFRKNGATLSSSTGPAASANAAYALIAGANQTTAGSTPVDDFDGQIGEILIFDRFLTPGQTATVEGYLACKWGLQPELPANHPFARTCPGAQVATPVPTPAPTGSALPEPPQLVSANGSLSLQLVASQNSAGNPQLTYDGSPVAPTLRLLPGDVLSVTLVNDLPTPPSGAGYVNDTNLHFHGLHVSPNAPADDSIDLLAMPGQTLQYKIAIPVDHPPGLYWYHSHAHGEAERQNLAGMSGALIIDGIANDVPAVANLPERVLIARDAPLSGQALPDANRKQLQAMFWAMAHANTAKAKYRPPGTMTMGDADLVRGQTTATTRNPYVTIDPRYRHIDRRRLDTSDGQCTGTAQAAVKALTLNGATQPTIGIRPGEQQFWRMVNAGSDTYLDVSVDNTSLQIVSIDGVPLARGVRTPASLTVPDYVLPPASRVEFIVTGPPAGSTAYLRTACFDSGSAGSPMPAAILATIDPTHSPTDAARKRFAQRPAPKRMGYRFPIYNHVPGGRATVIRQRTISYSDQNTIDGVAYDPSAAPRYYAQSGTMEEWTIVNNSSQVHTFHIHQIHFVLEAVNGIAQQERYVMDNVNVPAATASGPGTVKLLLDFTDPLDIGTFLFHCHILSHEDAGMMAKIRVGTAPPLSVGPTSLSFTTPSAKAQSATIAGGAAPYSISGCANVADASISGTTVTVTPAGAGNCVLTVSDSTGLSATIAVAVAAAPAPIVLSPSSLAFASATAAAQTATISGGKAPYAVSGCAGIASAAVDASDNGIVVTPSGVGTCSLTVTDSANDSTTEAVSVNGNANTNAADNLTFHHDPGRTGWYPAETTLTTTNVASSSFGLLGTISAPSGMPAFGKVYAQPLYLTSQTTSDGLTHNLVVIATATDQVYAVDDRSGAVVWEHNFTNPSAGITAQSWTSTQCPDVNPDIGIMATPVADRAKGLLYVLVPTVENGVFHRRLHALSLSSGADALTAVEASATVTLASGGTATTDPELNLARAALLEANGNIYIGLSSNCDAYSSEVHGWLLSFNASNLQFTGNAIDTTNAANGSNFFLGTIWMSGFGPAADAAGNIYTATGNGPYDGKNNFAMSILKLPGNLDITKENSFTPYGEAADSSQDADLGSGGVMVLPPLSGPDPNLVIAGGKCGAGSSNGGTQGCIKYVLNANNLGGFTSGDTGALFKLATDAGSFGGPAFFQDASGKSYVVYGGGEPLYTLNLGLNPPQLTTQSEANVGCLECRAQGSQPVVSSNGTAAGTAVVWALKTPGNSGGTLTLYAFDALNMSHTLFSGTAGQWTNSSGASYIGSALVSPLVANGRVYVPTDGGVAVFGLK